MPVCTHCNDTHRMSLGAGTAMCTRCPRPCQKCQAGPYCATTPCPCACHQPIAASRADGERIRAREHLARLRASLHAIEIDIETRNHPPGINAAQAITEAAVSLAMTMAKLDAYVRAEDKP